MSILILARKKKYSLRVLKIARRDAFTEEVR